MKNFTFTKSALRIRMKLAVKYLKDYLDAVFAEKQ